MPSGILLTGKRFGYLTVGRELRSDVYLCTCKCGEKITVFRSQLTHGSIRHCGCRLKKPLKRPLFGHYRVYKGRDGRMKAKTSAEFNSWAAMRNRCKYKSIAGYANYGGRGIAVCARWMEPRGYGFVNFLADMGVRPIGKSLDRENPNGHYCPENCRWADRDVQAHNQRRYLWPGGVGEPAVQPMDSMLEDSLACG